MSNGLIIISNNNNSNKLMGLSVKIISCYGKIDILTLKLNVYIFQFSIERSR